MPKFTSEYLHNAFTYETIGTLKFLQDKEEREELMVIWTVPECRILL